MIPTLKERLPSQQARRNIFTITVIVIQAWAFFNLFREVPAIRLRLDIWDVVGTVAYIQAFALFESLLVTGFVIALGMLFPKSLRETKFSAMGVAAILVTTCWSIFIHYDLVPLKDWSAEKVYGRLALLTIALILTLFPVWYSEKVASLINKLIKEGFTLAQLYALIGVLSIIIVVIRNVT